VLGEEPVDVHSAGTVQRVAQVPGRPLVTPEAVVLEFETAGLGSRILASTVDLTIQAIILFVGSIGLAALAAADGPTSLGISLLLALGFLTLFGYPAGFETLWRGRTPGKAAFGLRVVTREGTPIMFRHAAVRAALTIVDFWLSSGAVAVMSVLLTRDNQRLGDLAAGTFVLRERTGAERPEPVRFEIPPALAGYASTLDVRGLSSTEYTTVRAFLVRAPSLPPQTRFDLAARLAAPIAARLQTAIPAEIAAEDFLMCIAALYQRRGHLQAPVTQWSGPTSTQAPPRDEPPAEGPFTAPQ